VLGCCKGQKLIIGIRGIDELPFFDYQNADDAIPQATILPLSAIVGFVPEILGKLSSDMRMDVSYYTLGPNMSDDGIKALLDNSTIDAFVSAGWTAHKFGQAGLGGAYFFTNPFYMASMSGVVKLTRNKSDMWNFVDPFSNDLWVAVMCIWLCTSVTLLFIRCLDRLPPGSSLCIACMEIWMVVSSFRNLASALYTSLDLYLTGDNYEWGTGPEKVLRTSWLFFPLITLASYTANLAAFFTLPSISVSSPPTGMNDLIYTTACTTYPAALDPTAPLGDYVQSYIYPPAECKPRTPCATGFCYNAVQTGEVNVWIDDAYYLHEYVQSNQLSVHHPDGVHDHQLSTVLLHRVFDDEALRMEISFEYKCCDCVRNQPAGLLNELGQAFPGV
jgi:hypothetical protein